MNQNKSNVPVSVAEEPDELSYYRLTLLAFLRESHPDLADDESFVATRSEQAAEALANQSDNSRDLDTLIGEKSLESMQTQLDAMESENDLRARFEHERRMNRAEAIENLEGLAMLLDRLPAHDFDGYKMTGYANYVSCTINAALEVLKKNN